jgi:hypothetical protein
MGMTTIADGVAHTAMIGAIVVLFFGVETAARVLE